VDATSERLVELLVQDGRASLTALASALNLSVPAVKRRVDRLERDGVIRGYTALVDPDARSGTTEAIVELFCSERTGRREVEKVIAGHPEIRLALTVAGDSDVVLLVRTRDTQHLEDLLVTLRGSPFVHRTRAQVILGRVLDRGGL
jgi:Lrp/AsnC family leucine-responsive transcriptional regulator